MGHYPSKSLILSASLATNQKIGSSNLSGRTNFNKSHVGSQARGLP